MTLLALLKLIIPVIAFLVSYALQQNKFTPQMNAAVAAVTIVLASVAIVAIQGQFTQDINVDIALITATIASQGESFAVLQQYLRGNFPNSLPNKLSLFRHKPIDKLTD
jgi:hypothetical protein